MYPETCDVDQTESDHAGTFLRSTTNLKLDNQYNNHTMACSSMNITSSQIATPPRAFLGENSGLRRSSSMEELCKQATMRRSYSDNNLVCSSGCVCASSSRSSKLKPSRSYGIFPLKFSSSFLLNPIRSLLFETEQRGNETKSVDESLDDGDIEEEIQEGQKVKRANWVQRLLELRMQWKCRREIEECDDEKEDDGGDSEDGCLVDYDAKEEEQERVSFNMESFSRFLVQVPWSDAKRFAKLAFLCNKAYVIPEIKANDFQLQRYCGLNFVTSSLEKKAEAVALKAKLNKHSKLSEDSANLESNSETPGSIQEHKIRSSVAYEIAASAASHVQCCAKSECADGDIRTDCKSKRAAQMAASTMTAVVAAREKEKQDAAKELQSLHSSPCEWFICDDPCTHVRYFVTQGTESLAAWQANLFFEPATFENSLKLPLTMQDTEALVHRGIYEAAKGIYKQFLPEIQNHIKDHGHIAKFQFTGHSLGGSLSQLVHMMLIARGVVNPSMLLPVVTFGSPFVFCGGHKMLEKLGVNENQLHSVIMHRDIVPRAFSCSYPRQVAQVLKRLNGSFRSHPCLDTHFIVSFLSPSVLLFGKNHSSLGTPFSKYTKHKCNGSLSLPFVPMQKMLYSPLGKIFILQPAKRLSPSHPWLPPGCALYSLDNAQPANAAMALKAFLNTPHPLQTLSDPTAYGSEGTILRDHDSSNYAKALNGVMGQYTKMALREVRKERHLIWPLIASTSQRTWINEGNLENSTARKEIMTSV
ncbi:hypothetical protein Cgig2_030395 [Carnegiea gigantea]|uniref:Fungal lipase-type domain-containing protein n=1 Tax=Carnegiea gigantea TaxID=171969 RepID=A0A9Q1QKA4_9CARY|nr:hypothetical protein Cgig2_030395 [Carnegiea gigantea]